MGSLRAGINYTLTKRNTKIEANILSSEDYSAYVEYGTSPHFPPPRALEGWAQRHGFGEGGGFLVAKSIARRGTPAQPFMYPAYAEQKPKFIRNVRRVMSQP